MDDFDDVDDFAIPNNTSSDDRDLRNMSNNNSSNLSFLNDSSSLETVDTMRQFITRLTEKNRQLREELNATRSLMRAKDREAAIKLRAAELEKHTMIEQYTSEGKKIADVRQEMLLLLEEAEAREQERVSIMEQKNIELAGKEAFYRSQTSALKAQVEELEYQNGQLQETMNRMEADMERVIGQCHQLLSSHWFGLNERCREVVFVGQNLNAALEQLEDEIVILQQQKQDDYYVERKSRDYDGHEDRLRVLQQALEDSQQETMIAKEYTEQIQLQLLSVKELYESTKGHAEDLFKQLRLAYEAQGIELDDDSEWSTEAIQHRPNVIQLLNEHEEVVKRKDEEINDLKLQIEDLKMELEKGKEKQSVNSEFEALIVKYTAHIKILEKEIKHWKGEMEERVMETSKLQVEKMQAMRMMEACEEQNNNYADEVRLLTDDLNRLERQLHQERKQWEEEKHQMNAKAQIRINTICGEHRNFETQVKTKENELMNEIEFWKKECQAIEQKSKEDQQATILRLARVSGQVSSIVKAATSPKVYHLPKK